MILIAGEVCADWEKLLRCCENKGSGHSIPEIDFIYMVNLKERPNKWETSLTQLAPYGIIPYCFDAINGWKLDPNDFKNLGCPSLVPEMTPGKIGCLLSALSVLTDAYQSQYQTIWLMEGDIDVVENPLQLSELINLNHGF